MVSHELARRQESGEDVTEILLHTGQHFSRNMSDIFFDELFPSKPAYNLGVGGGSHGSMTGRMIEGIESVLLKESPDLVLVYGDTNSTLAGAVAASKLCVRIAHVEAGLRSFNQSMPEEINRIVTDRLSSLLFCPTESAVQNLKSEGCMNWKPEPKAVFSGDVMLDAATALAGRGIAPPGLASMHDFVLCTVHRAQNTDNAARLNNIVSALKRVAKRRMVIWPIHPRAKAALETGAIDASGITLIEPVGYLNMLWLLQKCSVVLTDSGGLQKEAFFYHKPCFVLRDETEWTELLQCGHTKLVGADENRIYAEVTRNEPQALNTGQHGYFGSGSAAKLIVDDLLRVQ